VRYFSHINNSSSCSSALLYYTTIITTADYICRLSLMWEVPTLHFHSLYFILLYIIPPYFSVIKLFYDLDLVP
jgi:hypothetical protein